MDTQVAELVAHTLRHEAVTAAHHDLRTLQRQAVDAGRDRSRRLLKTSRIDQVSGELRYNPAGRAMRDWYLHVYINTLRTTLGQPAVTIDPQQVEDTARTLHSTRPAASPVEALRAVAVVRDIAVDDAAHAATDIVTALRAAAMRRAVAAVPDSRFDTDQLAVHVGRHWYQRCYDDHIHAATNTRQPLTAVTDNEERHVATALATGIARQLIGTDGVPLVTAHDTMINTVDRRLAAGDVGVVPALADPDHYTDPLMRLRSRITRTWHSLADDERQQWATLAGTESIPSAHWGEIPGPDQDRLIRLYLDTHRPEYMNHPFDPPDLTDDPTTTAMAMFNHTHPLTAAPGVELSDPGAGTIEPTTVSAAEHTALPSDTDETHPQGIHL